MEELRKDLIVNDRYVLLEYIGGGSFGEVWRALDKKTDEEIAIKLYISLNSKGCEEFLAEYKIASGLKHPNLLVTEEYAIWENRPYLTMRFCREGSTSKLVRHLTPGLKDEKRIWQFIKDVSAGLSYLHNLKPDPIVHQDIKPDNVLIGDENRFVITDFGISKKVRSTMRSQSTRAQTAGATAYMAPERFSNNPTPILASDIWSLGASAYELAEGELPFAGMGGVLLKNGADMPDINKGWSENLNQLIHRCMAKEPWDRPKAADLYYVADQYIRNGYAGDVTQLFQEVKNNPIPESMLLKLNMPLEEETQFGLDPGEKTMINLPEDDGEKTRILPPKNTGEQTVRQTAGKDASTVAMNKRDAPSSATRKADDDDRSGETVLEMGGEMATLYDRKGNKNGNKDGNRLVQTKKEKPKAWKYLLIVAAFAILSGAVCYKLLNGGDSEAKTHQNEYAQLVENCRNLTNNCGDKDSGFNSDALKDAKTALDSIVAMENNYRNENPDFYNESEKLKAELTPKLDEAAAAWAASAREQATKLKDADKALSYYELSLSMKEDPAVRSEYEKLKQNSGVTATSEMSNEGGYGENRGQGIRLFNQGKYKEAKAYFQAAAACADKPAKNDLSSWTAKCDKQIAAEEAKKQEAKQQETKPTDGTTSGKPEPKEPSTGGSWQNKLSTLSVPYNLRYAVNVTSVSSSGSSVTCVISYEELSMYDISNSEREKISSDKSKAVTFCRKVVPSNVPVNVVCKDRAGRSF